MQLDGGANSKLKTQVVTDWTFLMPDFTPRILAFAGSIRANSLNKTLVRLTAAAVEEAGADVDIIDLRDYPMPLYDGDIEVSQGLPDKAVELRRLMLSHQGWLIASPEYNGSFTALLKNAIDWTSRPVHGEEGLAAYRNKVAALMSASPGSYGGRRGLMHIRSVLSNMGVIVLPDELAVGNAAQVLTSDHGMPSQRLRASIDELGKTLARTVTMLHGHMPVDQPYERRRDIGRIS